MLRGPRCCVVRGKPHLSKSSTECSLVRKVLDSAVKMAKKGRSRLPLRDRPRCPTSKAPTPR